MLSTAHWNVWIYVTERAAVASTIRASFYSEHSSVAGAEPNIVCHLSLIRDSPLE